MRRTVSFELILLAVLLLLAMAASVAFGSEPISLSRALFDASSLDRTIAISVRLPRVLLAAIAGAGLASCGVAFQSILRNPLAEPFVLGVSGGAAFGATVAILFFGTLLAGAIIPLAAFGGGLVATILVYRLSQSSRTGASSSTNILLAGVVINSIASAAITFLKTLVSATKAQELLFWLMGFLDVPSTTTLIIVAAYVAVGIAVLFADAGRLNVLALGDDQAEHLGVDVRALERRTFLACSCVVGAIVSVTGLIAFVGLIVPHAMRRIFGPDVRITLPASLLAGGTVLVVCDLASRALFRWLHTEPPVGAVTALVGGPLFLMLLRRSETSRALM
jgi:iron complex transport system permease protein